jgi:hypothetical protein
LNNIPNQDILFRAATVFARKIIVSKQLVTYGTHRMSKAKLDTGRLIVEEKWSLK